MAKSRIQNQSPTSGGELLKYRHTLQACATIVREEGAGALYKGFKPTLLRMVLGQGVAYASFELALGTLRER